MPEGTLILLIPPVILIGLIAGAIINALADELPYRRPFVWPPTYPDGTPRPPGAWSGIMAFLLKQRTPANPQPDEGRKRGDFITEAKLSWRYPLTELLTIGLMLLALYAATQHPDLAPLYETDPGAWWGQLAFWLFYMAVLVLITVIDIEHKLILFIVTLPAMAIAILNAVLIPVPRPGLQDAFLGALVGFGVFFILYQGGFVFTYIMGRARGERINTVAFGYGDVMMITLSGFMLGFNYIIFALFITVFLGAFGAFIYLVLRMALRGRYNMFTAIPYGPYIVAATIIMLLYGPQVQLALLGWRI